MTPEQEAEYEICQRRGHQPSLPSQYTTTTTRLHSLTTVKYATEKFAMNNPWTERVCQWCGTRYHFENTLVERTG